MVLSLVMKVAMMETVMLAMVVRRPVGWRRVTLVPHRARLARKVVVAVRSMMEKLATMAIRMRGMAAQRPVLWRPAGLAQPRGSLARLSVVTIKKLVVKPAMMGTRATVVAVTPAALVRDGARCHREPVQAVQRGQASLVSVTMNVSINVYAMGPSAKIRSAEIQNAAIATITIRERIRVKALTRKVRPIPLISWPTAALAASV